jgi:hypothetical protein
MRRYTVLFTFTPGDINVEITWSEVVTALAVLGLITWLFLR